jgi:hypothetical protein
MLNQALGIDSNKSMSEVKQRAHELKQSRDISQMVLAESKNSISNLHTLSPQTSSGAQRVPTAASSSSATVQNDFFKIQENYMRSLEYNYQLIYKLRDAKIFQVKRYIKLI